MKRKLRKQVKRLELSKETLRVLNDAGLERALGGVSANFTNCPSACAIGTDLCCQEH
jgi:hypothetical protein